MTTPGVRLLIIEGEGVAAPSIEPRSPFGPFEIARCAGLDAAAEALGGQPFDAVVLACRTVDARKLPQWASLSQAAAEPALLVLTTDDPGADLAMLLARQGVQDVQPLAIDPVDALPRALRLAVERKALERQARKSFATDLMTGLPNQTQLIEHANQLMALREREPAPMALIALRLEGLASVEARLGRESANVLRRKVAVRLRAAVRASDVVASTGHDSFAVLLSRFQDAGDAEYVGAKLIAAVRTPFSIAGERLTLPVAMGVSQYPTDGKDGAVLWRRAAGLAASAQAEGAPPPAANAAND